MNAVLLQQVTYAYPQRRVLDDVNIEIAQGKLTVLLGRNGAGKSTMLRLCAKFFPGYQGSIQCMGRELASWTSKEFARTTSYLGQSHRPAFPFSVEDVILTGRAGYIDFLPSRSDHDAVDEIIQDLGLCEFRNRIYTELSGGEQQLILLARSLVNKPSILLLDEPMNHLDFTNQTRVLSLVRSMVQKGVTVVITMHDPNMAFLYGDDILFVCDHKVKRDAENKPWHSPLLREIIPSFDVLSGDVHTFIIPR